METNTKLAHVSGYHDTMVTWQHFSWTNNSMIQHVEEEREVSDTAAVGLEKYDASLHIFLVFSVRRIRAPHCLVTKEYYLKFFFFFFLMVHRM